VSGSARRSFCVTQQDFSSLCITKQVISFSPVASNAIFIVVKSAISSQFYHLAGPCVLEQLQQLPDNGRRPIQNALYIRLWWALRYAEWLRIVFYERKLIVIFAQIQAFFSFLSVIFGVFSKTKN
jgi:hypothetical protein